MATIDHSRVWNSAIVLSFSVVSSFSCCHFFQAMKSMQQLSHLTDAVACMVNAMYLVLYQDLHAF